MHIDVPTHYLPALERSLSKQGLAIQPYLKNGVQRWRLDAARPGQRTSIPETIIATCEEL